MTPRRWRLLTLLAVGATSPLLPWLLGLPEGGLAATVRWVPIAWSLLAWLGLPRPSRGLALTLGWLVVAGALHQSGLTFGPQLAIAGLYLLLGCALWSLRPILLEAIRHSEPRRPPPLFFVLPLFVYLFLTPWSTAERPPDGDEPYYILIAHSLAYDFDADLSNNYDAEDSRRFLHRALEPQLGDPVGRQGERYSRHNVLLGAVLTLPYRLAGRPGVLGTMALFSAALAWWALRLLRRLFPSSERADSVLLAWKLFALAPPLLLYGHQVWTEVPATLLLLIAFDALLDEETTGSLSRLALVVLILPFLKFRFALLSGTLILIAARRRMTRPRLLLLGLGLTVVGITIAGINLYLFGEILKHYSTDELRLDQRPLLSYLRSTLGLAFDGAFGLFAAAPLWLLLIPSLGHRAVVGNPALRRAAILLAPYLLLVASRQEWFGGWSPPFRYALVALPFLAAALVPALGEITTGGRRFLVAALVGLTASLTLLWLVVPGWTYNLADGGNHLIDHLARRTGNDLRALWPSYVRTGPAAWLWPPLLTGVVLGLWHWPSRRRLPIRVDARTAGVAALLLASSVLLIAGARLPTRAIEFEDPQVQARPGSLYPERWTPDRQRFRGGRTLRQGDELRVPVVDRSSRLDLTLEIRFIENTTSPTVLTISSGETPIATWNAEGPDDWQQLTFEDLSWSPDQPLVLSVGPSPSDPTVNGILVDRAELRWR